MDTIRSKTGLVIDPYFSATKIRWILENVPDTREAADRKEFQSYWRQSAAVNSLRDYINMDFDGLGSAAEKLLAGLEIPVKIQNFKNDLTSFESADDVLTLLIHFGYVTYE